MISRRWLPHWWSWDVLILIVPRIYSPQNYFFLFFVLFPGLDWIGFRWRKEAGRQPLNKKWRESFFPFLSLGESKVLSLLVFRRENHIALCVQAKNRIVWCEEGAEMVGFMGMWRLFLVWKVLAIENRVKLVLFSGELVIYFEKAWENLVILFGKLEVFLGVIGSIFGESVEEISATFFGNWWYFWENWWYFWENWW